MVVTGLRRETLAKNAPPRIDVLGGKDLEGVNSRRPSDVIGNVTGVDVQAGTGMGIPEKKTVSLDGLPAYYTLVLVDGVRILSSHFHTGADLDLIPSENIERIEVLKGPGAAQYGSNAVSGVVNIITKKGTPKPELDFESRAGTHHTYESSLALRGPVGDNVLYNAYAGWEQSDGTGLIEPQSRLGQLDYKNLSLGDKIDVNLGKTRVNASVNYADISSTFAHNPASSRLFIPSVNVHRDLSAATSIEAGAAYSLWEFKGIEQDADNSVVFFPELNEIVSPHVILAYDGLKGNEMAAGVDYDYAVFERTAVPRHDQHRAGLYAQDNVRFSEQLRLLGAVRCDMVKNTVDTVRDAVADKLDTVKSSGPVVSPSLSALYRPSDALAIRLSAGRGFRAPSLQELFQTRFGHEDAIVNGNPALKPEYSSTVDGSIDLSPAGMFSITIGGAATWISNMIQYYNTGRDTTVFDPIVRDTPTVHIFGRQNIARAFVGEGDISFKIRLQPITVQAGYSYTYNRDLDSNRILSYFPGSGISAKISGEWKLGAQWSIEPYVAVKAGFGRRFMSQGMESGEVAGEVALENYTDLSGGISVSYLNRFSLFFKASNLLGQEMESYEDILMKTNGDRLIEGGLKVSVF
jgi:outer membrane receptor protein involved in Fe transport